MALLAAVFAVSASPVWGSTAANTRIISQVITYYQVDGADQTASAGSSVVVNLVAGAPDVATGPARSTVYDGAATNLSDGFVITATSNGPDTYDVSSAVTASTNTGGATATPEVGTIQLGATVTAAGSSVTDIVVPSDGVSDGSVNGIAAGDTVVISGEIGTVQSVVDNANGFSTVILNAALSFVPAEGILVAEQATITVAVTAGTAITAGADVTVSVNITVASRSGSHPATTSDDILNTYTNGLATLTSYVRNITHAGMGGDAAGSVGYGGNTYYSTGVRAQPGDVLEYLLIANSSSGTISAARLTLIFYSMKNNI